MNHLALCQKANEIFQGNCFEKKRIRKNVDARIAVSVILRSRKYYTFQKIGNVFGVHHDHVIYYQKKHKDLMLFDSAYRNKFNELHEIAEGLFTKDDGICEPCLTPNLFSAHGKRTA
ncbi:hypothetical protein [Flavobacterium sedimenticola]|uniref:Chromosomal replication initiator DnaA C-terminal domain-containing protein n=1 Tax=Flavobacterium sedimenticola TaxID=3043286 RepID=A0ABT6XND8_9FLAO|nr:hypothetical protein [Flavobacterium sedimenticola]MDI9256352.1 hypothetical protein [Flavobacterium sedimenticola]